MPTLLALTVGGSCTPIITAIKNFKPDQVIFFASTGARGSRVMVDGPDSPCGGEKSIVAQCQLTADRYNIVEINFPDALSECYNTMRSALSTLANQYPDWKWIADYTGGTKTMTAALAIVAIETGWELSLVGGQRIDLNKVLNNSQMAGIVNTIEVRVQQRLEEASILFDQYAYSSAGKLLESLLLSSPLNVDSQQTIRRWVSLCRGFDAWDRFDHAGAAHLLQPFQSEIVPQWMMLKVLAGQRSGNGYEMVFDLAFNADRRAERGRYDDAIARLYRALEMLAQVRLSQRTPPLNSSALDVALLPENLRAKYASLESNTNSLLKKIGLIQDYDLLAELEDPLGKQFSSMRGRLLSALERRNASILAHGQSPLNENDYITMRSLVESLLEQGLSALKITRSGVQFPRLTRQGILQR